LSPLAKSFVVVQPLVALKLRLPPLAGPGGAVEIVARGGNGEEEEAAAGVEGHGRPDVGVAGVSS